MQEEKGEYQYKLMIDLLADIVMEYIAKEKLNDEKVESPLLLERGSNGFGYTESKSTLLTKKNKNVA